MTRKRDLFKIQDLYSLYIGKNKLNIIQLIYLKVSIIKVKIQNLPSDSKFV